MALTPRSVRARLTLWYTLVLSVPLAIFAVASYLVFSRALYERTDAFISDALSVFARESMAERRAAAESSIDALRVTANEVRFRDVDILVFDTSGVLLTMSKPRDAEEQRHARGTAADSVALIQALAGTHSPLLPSARNVVLPSATYRVISRALDDAGRRFVLAGMYSLHDVEAALKRIREMFLIAIPLLIASAMTGGWFLAKRSLAPMEEAFEQQRRFMADASHELRTPAATLRAEADVTLSRPQRSEAEYRDSMAVVQDAARRMSRIVDDIFLLARADAGHLVMQRETVDLDEIVIDAVRSIQPIAAQRQVTIELRDVVDARIDGDPYLVARVILNLLDNAVKYAPEGSAVEVSMANADAGGARAYEVRVVDSGPGIPPEARERVFDRFYRVDAARSRAEASTSSGAGLGLPIARRIAELHGGRVELLNADRGRTEFVARFPALAPVPESARQS